MIRQIILLPFFLSLGNSLEFCDLLIGIDEPLFNAYGQNLNTMALLVRDYVSNLDQKFHKQVLIGPYNGIHFRLKEMRIMYDLCTKPSCDHDPDYFLDKLGKIDASKFCLVHVLTKRVFDGAVGRGTYRSICKPNFNIGFTSFRDEIGIRSKQRIINTMAHEIGHNLGADHAKYKGFIMSISDSLNEVNFSPVTVDVLQTNLDFVRKTRNCFNMEYIETFSVCGNGKIEGDEECDCGLSYESCQDPCCYAAQISSEDLTLNASATPCRRHTQPRCYQEPPTRFKKVKKHTEIIGYPNEGKEYCDLLIGIDEPLFDEHDRDMGKIGLVARDYINGLDDKYHESVLVGKYGKIHFRIKEIRVIHDLCTDSQCDHSSSYFLKKVKEIAAAKFCLVHVLTNRVFDCAIGRGFIGTVCQPGLNIGLTTFKDDHAVLHRTRILNTIAHEVGHNLGADHIKSDGYIMSSRGSYNEVIFHPVTIEVIQKNLDYVRKTYNCFTSDVFETFSACGNGIKEGEEECDCGMSYGTCQDPCCYPSNISSADLTLNASATPCRRHLQPRCFQQYRSARNLEFSPKAQGPVLMPILGGTVAVLIIGLTLVILGWIWKRKTSKTNSAVSEIEKEETSF